MPYTPSIGTISHATLNTGHLMVAFADELRQIDPAHKLIAEADAVQTLWAAGWNDLYDTEEAAELVDLLRDALSEHAPPYCYFGTLEGDGAEFGFWPDMQQVDELPKFNDLADVPADIADDYVIVSDHGNVTLYSADGREIWGVV